MPKRTVTQSERQKHLIQYWTINTNGSEELGSGGPLVVNTSKSDTTGYLPLELVYGRLPSNSLDAALGYEGLEELANPTIFTEQVQLWLHKTREIAIEKVNRMHDKQAHRFDAKRSPKLTRQTGDLVFEWKPVSGEFDHRTFTVVDGPS